MSGKPPDAEKPSKNSLQDLVENISTIGVAVGTATIALKHSCKELSKNESADVRPPCDASKTRCSRRIKRTYSAHELDEKPEADENDRRNLGCEEKHEEGYESKNPCGREKHHVGA